MNYRRAQSCTFARQDWILVWNVDFHALWKTTRDFDPYSYHKYYLIDVREPEVSGSRKGNHHHQ